MDKQDDFDLFLAEIGDVKPLKQGDVVRTQSNANDALAKSLKRNALLKETQADKYHLALSAVNGLTHMIQSAIGKMESRMVYLKI